MERGFSRIKPSGEFVRRVDRKRHAEEKPLNLSATLPANEVELRLRFDAFGRRRHSKAVSEADDGFDDR